MYAAILKNEATGRYHPVLFRASPRPSDDPSPDRVCRHRSSGHHTDGFETLEAAEEMIGSDRDLVPTGLVMGWDGRGVPATTLDLPLLADKDEGPSAEGP